MDHYFVYGDEMVRVGGREVAASVAREWVRTYLNGARGQFGYPSYDGYRTNDDPQSLCDGDLLAPVLLNVQVKIGSFADLRACLHDLEAALRYVPLDVELIPPVPRDSWVVGDQP
jgi:hypothetical protein